MKSVGQEQEKVLKVSRSLFDRKAKSSGNEKRSLLAQKALEESKSDLDLSSEESEEIIPSDNSSDSSDDDEEGEDEKPKGKGKQKEVKKKKGKIEKRRKAWEDQEELTEIEDDDEFKEVRGANQKELLAEISRSLAKDEEELNSSVFQPDEKSEEIAKKWVIKPILESSPRWIKFGREEKEEIQQQVLSGIIPKGTQSVTDMARHYWIGLRKLLGLIQQAEIKTGRAHKLFKGRLQLWQYFDVKGPNFFQFYRARDFLEILNSFKSHGMKKHILGGWTWLMTGPILKFTHTHAHENKT